MTYNDTEMGDGNLRFVGSIELVSMSSCDTGRTMIRSGCEGGTVRNMFSLSQSGLPLHFCKNRK